MLPGRTYTPTDYLAIAWRRRWYIIVPLVLVGSVTAMVGRMLPNRFRASASIQVIPQRVPEQMVQPTVTAELSERLDVITKQIISRTRLETIIREFNLYEDDRKTMIMEDVVERMRKDINVNVDGGKRRRDAVSFSVSFEADNARRAMQVAERLSSLFVSENIEDRRQMASQTDVFLQAQLAKARQELQAQEAQLQGFRQRNNGQLPDQVQSNLSLLQSSQTRLQNVIEAGNRDRDRLQALERNLADAQVAAATQPLPAPPKRGNDENAPTGTAVQRLEQARASLRALELRLKPEHPDVSRAKRTITELEAEAEAELLQQPLATTAAAPVVPVDRAAAQRLDNLRREIQDVQQRLESSKREQARLEAAVTLHTGRVQVAPALESELSRLTRDYNTVQQTYNSLLKKAEESKLAMNLEERQIGEQFRVIDGARLPERPISPDRVRIAMLGILGGLALGLGLVALLEFRDSSFRSDDDIVTTLSLPVIAVIPMMTSGAERRAQRRRRFRIAATASVGGLMVAALAVVVWRFQLVDKWLR